MKKKILFLIVGFLLFKTDAFALTYGGCEYSAIARLKSLVGNINISYDYKIVENKAYFDVTLTNIPEGVYFVDNKTNLTYSYDDTDNGELTIKNYEGNSGTYKFFSALTDCYGTSLSSKYYNFPKYNIYYGDELCLDIPNYSLCQKWASVNYNRDEFEKIVNEYKNKENSSLEEQITVVYEKNLIDKIAELYAKYYYLFLGAMILACVISIIIKRRKDSFNL